MSQLKLYLLGAPRMELDNQPVELPRRKVLAILIYVALTGQRLQRDALAAMLWPASESKSARASLRRELNALNNAIGTEWLETTRDEVSLPAEANVWSDVEAFRAALRDIGEGNAAEALRDAVALYQGDFLAGFTLSDCPTFDDWQFFESESLRSDYADALAQLVQLAAAQGQYADAIDCARRWLALDTLDESVHRELMRLYALAGQQAAALRQYEECIRLLDDELGVEPDAETEDLYEAIRSRQFSAGEQDEKVKRWQGDKVTDVHPVTLSPVHPVTSSPPRHNLPAQATSFVGRAEELAAICQMLVEQAECRLLTLVGPGGIGKTRLALEIAQQIADGEAMDGDDARYADGVFFVQLETVDHAEQLVTALANAVEFVFQGGAEPREQLLRHLQSKQMLLLLDNFEHLLAAADLLTVMLQAAPGISLLVTSREALALQEEWLYGVSGFAAPAADAGAGAVEQNSAVQLFLQRARRADSSLVLDQEAWASVVRICQLVDGLPLGLELAAAWVRALSVAEIADEIARDLDFLTATTRGLPERHSSLRTVLEQTWRLLTPPEQDLFCRLAIFHNGFTRQAANRVADASIMTLAALVRKSIISHSRDGRYAMHGLLRQFASTRLQDDADLAEATAEKHSRYYGMWVQSLEGGLTGADHAAVLEQIGQDIENIRAGWRWTVAHVGNDPAQVTLLNRYVAAYFQFYDTRSRFQEGRAEFQLALDGLEPLAAERDEQLVLGRVCGRLGWLTFQTGQPALAKSYLERSIDLLRQLDARDELIFSLNYLGAVHRHLQEYDAAVRVLEESRQICQARNDRFGLTVALNILGQIAFEKQEYGQAQAHLAESLAIKQAIGDQRGAVFSLLYLGLVARAQDDFAQAVRLFQEGIQISEQHGDRRSIALGLNNLAEVEALMGHAAEAEKLYGESLQIYADISNLLGMVTTHIRLGDLARGQNNADATAHHYEAALRMAEDLQVSPQALESLIRQARIWLAGEQVGGGG